MCIKGYGVAGMTNLETGSIAFELAKKDASMATFVCVHNLIGTAVVNALGDPIDDGGKLRNVDNLASNQWL